MDMIDKMAAKLDDLTRRPVRRREPVQGPLDTLLNVHSDKLKASLKAGSTLTAISRELANIFKEFDYEARDTTIRRKLSDYVSLNWPELRRKRKRRK